MSTLQDRLADLAREAPRGGAPAAELWARGRRAGRLRASAVAITALAVVGAGIAVAVPDQVGPRAGDVARPGGDGIALPIEYPVGRDLPDLGRAPGPLAAVWLAPREAYSVDDDDPGLAPEAVGLVAETGRFGTLPLDLSPWVYESPSAQLALSPDGRRIAYLRPAEDRGDAVADAPWELVTRDLVTGKEISPSFDFDIRGSATWVDATRLVGHVADGSDADGWLWEPGTAPQRVDPHPYLDGDHLGVTVVEGDPPWTCRTPTVTDRAGRSATSVVCDVRGVIGSEVLLGHLRAGPGQDPDDLERAVIALDISDGTAFPFDDPDLRRVVVTAGAPHPVTFATDLIAQALAAGGHRS